MGSFQGLETPKSFIHFEKVIGTSWNLPSHLQYGKNPSHTTKKAKILHELEKWLSPFMIFTYHNLYICRHPTVYKALSYPLFHVSLVNTLKGSQDYVIWYFKD